VVLKIDLGDQAIEHLQFPSDCLGPTATIALLKQAIPNRLIPHHCKTDQVEHHAGRQVVAIQPLRRHACGGQSPKAGIAKKTSNGPASFGKRWSRLEVGLDRPQPGPKMKTFVCWRIEFVDAGPTQSVEKEIEPTAWKLFDSGDPPHTDRFAQRNLFEASALAVIDHGHRDRIGPFEIAVSRSEAPFHHLSIPRFEDVQRLRTMWQQRHTRKREERDRLSEIDAIRGHQPDGSPLRGTSANQIRRFSGRGEQFATVASGDAGLNPDLLETRRVETEALHRLGSDATEPEIKREATGHFSRDSIRDVDDHRQIAIGHGD
jgi:hypothetical protein